MEGSPLPPMASLLAALLATGFDIGAVEDVTEDDRSTNEDLIKILGMLDPHDLSDLVHGTTREHKKAVPHPQRFWAREGQHMDSSTFSTMFRCMRETFYELVDQSFGTTKWLRVGGGRGTRFDPCERMAVFLYRMGHSAGARETAVLFGLSVGAVHHSTITVAERVRDVLNPRYVCWPGGAERECISREWEAERDLRHVVGAVDGSHIRIQQPPPERAKAYYNRKGFYSMVLLAICDNRGKFRWFTAGAPGSCGDSGVLKRTDWYNSIEKEQSKPDSDRQMLSSKDCILGDSAFAERPFMRTPIVAPDTRAKRFYNYKHSCMRAKIEHAFGRLKWKFPALRTGLLFSLPNCPLVISACVVLHNFILEYEGESGCVDIRDDAPTGRGRGGGYGSGDSGVGRGAGNAQSPRNVEVNYLNTSGILMREWGQSESKADRRRLALETRHSADN